METNDDRPVTQRAAILDFGSSCHGSAAPDSGEKDPGDNESHKEDQDDLDESYTSEYNRGYSAGYRDGYGDGMQGLI